MPATTYLTDYDREKFASVEDRELNELFQEIRQLFPNYYLNEFYFKEQRLLRMPRKIVHYSLYIDFGCEAQIFSFPASGLSYMTNKLIVITYFFGLINGYEKGKKENKV